MAAMKERELGRYQATDQFGNVHTVIHTVEYAEIVSLDSVIHRDSNHQHVRTLTWDEVGHLGKGRYQLATGELLTSTDPNAP